jgi:hypothetical protein
LIILNYIEHLKKRNVNIAYNKIKFAIDNWRIAKYPEFYINEDTLRKKARETLEKISFLKKT